jgi:hypothetical protein
MRSQVFRFFPQSVVILLSGLAFLTAPPMASAQEITDEGDLILTYLEPQDPEYTPIYASLIRTQWIDEMIDATNATFALPTDVQIVFDECGVENAFYNGETQEITMCYELMATYIEIYELDIETEEDYDIEVYYSALYTLFHEIGHAFVDVYDLPITGKEEDAVDEFAAIILLEISEDGIDATLTGIDQFLLDSEQAAILGETPYWAEHSLSVQRYFTLSCLVYGSDPESYAEWVGDEDYLPPERAETCPAEYEQKRNSWLTLLDEAYLE